MAQNQIIKLKRSNVSGNIPASDQLQIGEIALNMADSLLYYKDPSGVVKPITIIDVLKLDNQIEYSPSSDFHPATKAYVDLSVLQNLVELRTIERTAISNARIKLPSIALGDIVHNIALIFDDINTNVFLEATCTLSEDKTEVLFNNMDNLDYKYCTLTYLSLKNTQIL